MPRQARQLAGIGASDLPNQAAVDAYVGPPREIVVGAETVHIQDGQTPGGIRVPTRTEATTVQTLGTGAVRRPTYAAVRERAVPVSAFGITETGDITGAISKALAARAERDAADPWRRSSPVELPPGDFNISTGFVADFSSAADATPDHLTFQGAGSGQTKVAWRGNAGTAFSYTGGGGEALHAIMCMKGMYLFNQGTGANTAIKLNAAAYFDLEDIHTLGFDLDLDLVDCLTARFYGLRLTGGRRGIWARKGTLSHPNAITNIGCVVAGKSEWGEVWDRPSLYKRVGGSIEGCGSGALASRGGILINLPGSEGMIGADIDNCYFEGTRGLADLMIDGVAPRGDTIINVSSSFNNLKETQAPDNNIYARTGATDPSLLVNIAGSSFGHYQDYVPANHGAYLKAEGQARFIGAALANYMAPSQRPAGILNAFASCVFDGRPTGTYPLAITNQLGSAGVTNVASIIKNNVGRYTINFRARGKPPYHVTAFYLLPGAVSCVINSEDADKVYVMFYDAAGAFVDVSVRLRIDC